MTAMKPETPHLAPLAYPVAFDRERRQLFVWYHPPALRDGQGRDCVVVLCNPIGYDAICTHRHYRVLAQQLADAGFAVLRYDHHGTGDSAGNDEDPQRIRAWTNGVARAVEFARLTSGASHVSLFGVRMGATLAISAAAAMPIADSLIAWAPFPSGSNYLREMRALRMMRDADTSAAPLVHDGDADPGEEAAGYLLTASTITELSALNLLSITVPPVAQALFLARDDIPENEKLPRHLQQIGCEISQLKVPGYAAMMRDTFDSAVPEEALGQIRSWLDGRYPLKACSSTLPASAVRHLIAGSRGAESNVVESPASFGDNDRLFGIVSESIEQEGDRGRTGVIFVSVGSNHHVGPNRMYVKQARALASLGFRTLRMDIGGVGESPAAPGHQDNHLYAMHSVDDVQAAVKFMREQRQVEHIVLVGVCSGAYLSYHAAVADPGIASIVLINPQTFSWKEGDSLELHLRTGIRAMRHYRSSLFNVDTWKRLVTGQVNVSIIAHGVATIFRKRMAVRLASWKQQTVSPSTATSQPNVKHTFRQICRRGVNTFLLYSANDGGLDEMETQLGQNAAAVRKDHRFKLQIVDGADHTFTPLWAQRRLQDLLTQHLMRLYG